jgi:uncharacterized membrane protein
MNGAQLHLVFTHLPIVGLGIAILVNFYSLFNRSHEVKKVMLGIYIVAGLGALLAYLTGDGAEEVMKTYPGITEDIIETHEQFGLFFFIGMMILAAAAFFELILVHSKKSMLRNFALYLLIPAILVGLLAIKTGSTGGVIRHPEVSQGMYQKVQTP